jgi:peptide/nickel transport system substrate-binding protein
MVFSLAACGGSGSKETPPAAATDAAAATATPAPAPAATAAPPPAATGPQYGGILKIVGNDTSESFGIPWIGQSYTRPFNPWGESLVTENAYGEIGPYLAASWEIDMDKAQVVFQLRKGIKFSDGSDFNADAAAWNIDQRIETGNWIKEFKDAEATGEYELTVHLNRWDNNVLGTLASRANIMISKENFENNGLDYANEHPVGTGPFVLKEKVSGYHVLFVKNENYWQEGLPYLDGIDYIELSDEMAQNAALQATGDEAIDVLTSRSISQLTTMTAGGTGIRLVQGFAGPVCLFPSSMDENSPLSKLEVRQAISYAIDRDTLCSALGPKFYTPALQLYPEPFKGVLPDSYNCTYDPDKAKELLTAAGYPDGINISFFVPPTMDKDAMIAVSKMLGDAGIQCDMQFPETALANDLNYKGWDNGVLASPSRAFSNITSTYYFDFDADYFFKPCVWRPEELGELYTQSRQTKEVDAAIVSKMHQIVMENMLTVPIYNTMDNYLIRETVHDTGYGEWGLGTQTTLERAWKEAD